MDVQARLDARLARLHSRRKDIKMPDWITQQSKPLPLTQKYLYKEEWASVYYYDVDSVEVITRLQELQK